MTELEQVPRVRLAMLGRGAIAKYIAERITRGVPNAQLVGTVGRARFVGRLPAAERNQARGASFDVAELLGLRPEWVLEAASTVAARDLVLRSGDLGVGLILMSVGALAEDEIFDEVRSLRSRGLPVLLPAGAIGGLDAIEALGFGGGLTDVSLTTTKSPAGWFGAPYVIQRGIDLSQHEATTIFVGSAREAISGFPANTNVAVALALAGVGMDRTRVELRSDSGASRTSHRITARGHSGLVQVTVESDPIAGQPRSSQLAAKSALVALRSIQSGLLQGVGRTPAESPASKLVEGAS